MNITKGKVDKSQKCVIYGPEGVGKTSFASQFPEPLFIDTEGSTSHIDVARLDKPTSWTMLLQQIDYVKQNRSCKTLVIDSVDWAERLAIEFVTSRANKESITSFGYGEGFIQLEETFGKFLNKLSDLIEVGINVVLTAHAKIIKFEQQDEMGAYDRWELKLGNKTTAKTAALTKEWADCVLFMNYKTFSVATDSKGTKHKAQGGVRTIYATHHPAWDAKNRHGLPDEFPMEYSRIAHLFKTDLPVTQTTAPIVETVIPVITQQPEPTQAPTPTVTTETQSIDPNIPQSLKDLMTQHKVTEQEIQIVVSKKGYYPEDTPITNYDPTFINGVLVAAWQQVYGMITDFRKTLPF